MFTEDFQAVSKFIKRNKKATVDEIVESFIKKYPKYKKNKSEVYERTCILKGISNQKK